VTTQLQLIIIIIIIIIIITIVIIIIIIIMPQETIRNREPRSPTDLIRNNFTLSKLIVVLQATRTIRREHQVLL